MYMVSHSKISQRFFVRTIKFLDVAIVEMLVSQRFSVMDEIGNLAGHKRGASNSKYHS